MTRDLDDTVIGVRRAPAPRAGGVPDFADTIVRTPAGSPELDGAAVDGPVQAGGPRARCFGIRLGDSAPVPLDVPAIVGRRPRAPRVPTASPPRLVTVAAASQHVSASHVEVRQVGESVVVTDLRATNGTRVRMPGAAPQTLRPGESAVAVAGTTIDLGDGIVLEVVALHRLPATGDDRD